LGLMMLIGGYGAQAQSVAQQEEATKTEVATTEFLGLKWGLGIGVIGSFGGDRAVEKASIINGVVRVEEEGDLRPQSFLEMHIFLDKKAMGWREYQRKKSAAQMRDALGQAPNWPAPEDPPLTGVGPFIAVQSSDKKVIDTFSFGVMWGVRKDPKSPSSLNIGIGLSFNPNVQVLGGGLKDGQKTDETEIRFKKEGQLGWAVMASFTF
ncbi:MAG TPA: hypothetical protein VLX28_23370, partial [Thermoanaerobaculia bacterium]|nr:hypothetical protein [Thermoanaerobaculia bacterium]